MSIVDDATNKRIQIIYELTELDHDTFARAVDFGHSLQQRYTVLDEVRRLMSDSLRYTQDSSEMFQSMRSAEETLPTDLSSGRSSQDEFLAKIRKDYAPEVPFLSDGMLEQLNKGTGHDQSLVASLQQRLSSALGRWQ